MSERVTHYTESVLTRMLQVGHATNGELLEYLRVDHPELSATTVHRITARLVERGKLAVAPVAAGNVMRFDAATAQHDHFHCRGCDLLRDTMIAESIRPILEDSIGDGCRVSGNLVISGLCKNCNKGVE